MTDEPLHMKVLSIDFDFFQDVDAYTMVSNYPDGVDAATFLSSLIWTGHYVKKPRDTTTLLDSVKINEELYHQIVRIIRNQEDSTTPVMVMNSHAHIYQLIKERYPEYRDCYNGELFIDHIDMHHDFENNNKEPDCGNWVSKVLELFPDAHIRWFAREVGVDIYKIEPEKLKPYAFDLKDILEEQYDFIFLCRSDNWLPPHLDCYFDDLYQEILSCFDENVFVDDQVSQPRDIKSILDSAHKQEQWYIKEYDKQMKKPPTEEGNVDADSNPAQ